MGSSTLSVSARPVAISDIDTEAIDIAADAEFLGELDRISTLARKLHVDFFFGWYNFGLQRWRSKRWDHARRLVA